MNTVDVPRFRQLLADITANRDRLDACKMHNFGDVQLPFTMGQHFTCIGCGGSMKAVDAFRYIQGFEAAGGNPNKVMNGYRPDWKPADDFITQEEAGEMAYRFSCVLEHATGGRMSKTNYTLEAMKSVIDDHITDLCRADSEDQAEGVLQREHCNEVAESRSKQFCKVCDGSGHGVKKHWGDFPKCEACNGTCYEDPSK